MIPSSYATDAIGLGLWFATIGFYLLIFVYLYFFKWRQTKNIFLLCLGVFFLCLTVGRGFFMFNDFFLVPEIFPISTDSPLLYALINPMYWGVPLPWIVWINPLYWRLGSFWEWIALGWLTVGISITLIDNKTLRRIVPVIPLLAAFVIILLPEDLLFSFGIGQINYFAPEFIFTQQPLITFLNYEFPTLLGFIYQPSGWAYIVMNYGLAAIYAITVPLIFFYVAWQGIGTIRKRGLLLGFGFTIYYVGRVIQATLIKTYLPEVISTILAPALAMIALVLIYYGIRYEEVEKK
ncbi:MAG: hypothetical protein WED07_05490 [Candidatus Freyarchaeum deiterrae]